MEFSDRECHWESVDDVGRAHTPIALVCSGAGMCARMLQTASPFPFPRPVLDQSRRLSYLVELTQPCRPRWDVIVERHVRFYFPKVEDILCRSLNQIIPQVSLVRHTKKTAVVLSAEDFRRQSPGTAGEEIYIHAAQYRPPGTVYRQFKASVSPLTEHIIIRIRRIQLVNLSLTRHGGRYFIYLPRKTVFS